MIAVGWTLGGGGWVRGGRGPRGEGGAGAASGGGGGGKGRGGGKGGRANPGRGKKRVEGGEGGGRGEAPPRAISPYPPLSSARISSPLPPPSLLSINISRCGGKVLGHNHHQTQNNRSNRPRSVDESLKQPTYRIPNTTLNNTNQPKHISNHLGAPAHCLSACLCSSDQCS